MLPSRGARGAGRLLAALRQLANAAARDYANAAQLDSAPRHHSSAASRPAKPLRRWHGSWDRSSPHAARRFSSAPDAAFPASPGAGQHYGQLTPAARQQMCDAVGGRVSSSASVLQQHGQDESYHTPLPPELVVFPQSTEEVSQVGGLPGLLGARGQQGTVQRLGRQCAGQSPT
jgi:hypothetical protein